MSKNKQKSGSKIHSQNWKDYDEEGKLLYSYLKKKGKHKRGENQKTHKR